MVRSQIESTEARAEYLEAVSAATTTSCATSVETLLADTRSRSFLESPPQPDGGHQSTFVQSAERPGTHIGPYKLLEEIGEGGMGIVYMAEQKEPVRRKVALKIIKPGMDTRQVVARFEAERQALAMMDHPNIAQVHRWGHHRVGPSVLRDGAGQRDADHGVL